MRDTATFECGCKVTGMRTAPYGFGLLFCRLHSKADDLLKLLREWRATPFFETRAEWEAWVKDFGVRVDAALKSATPRAKKTTAPAEGGA